MFLPNKKNLSGKELKWYKKQNIKLILTRISTVPFIFTTVYLIYHY